MNIEGWNVEKRFIIEEILIKIVRKLQTFIQPKILQIELQIERKIPIYGKQQI